MLLVECVEKLPYFFPFCLFCKRAWVWDRGDVKLFSNSVDLFFVKIRERPYECEVAFEQLLAGNKCAQIAAVQYIQEECLDDVFLVMAKGDFIVSFFPCNFEQEISPLSGTVITSAFSFLCVKGVPADRGFLDDVWEAKALKLFFDKRGFSRTKSHVKVNCEEFIVYRGLLFPEIKEPGKDQGVYAAGNSDDDPVFIGEHFIVMHCLADEPVCLFCEKRQRE